MTPRIVVTRHRPWLRALIVAGVAAAVAIGGFGFYLYVQAHTVAEFRENKSELQQLRDERHKLVQQLRGARAEASDLRHQLSFATRSGDIDEEACASVKDSLSSLQAEASDLREQVAFYRNIVSPDETRAGVRVLDLKMAPLKAGTKGANRWRYDLVLIQSVRHDKRVAGNTQIKLLGSQGGQEMTLDLASLMTSSGRLPGFAFKYFQESSGEFRLPDGFRPLRATVTLTVDGEGAPRVISEYDWAKIEQQEPAS